jgi:hypothetical protein
MGTLQGLHSDNSKGFCAWFSDTWFERCSSPQGFRLVLFILILIQYNMLDSALKETKLFYFIVRYVFEQLLY